MANRCSPIGRRQVKANTRSIFETCSTVKISMRRCNVRQIDHVQDQDKREEMEDDDRADGDE